MMFNIRPWFTGFSLILVHLNKNFRLTSGQCDVKMEQLYADCFKRNLTKIPNDLNQGIEIMNISHNYFENFTELDFIPYVNIKVLIMTDLSPSHVSIKLFDPLYKLEILDISETFWGSPPAKLPPSIQRFYADGTGVKINISLVDFTVLVNLESFSMSKSRLEGFPRIPETAPLIDLDLSTNPLTTFTYSDIASYCALQTLRLSGVNLQLSNQACCDIKKWTDVYNISIDLKFGESCSGSEQLSADAIEKYERCQNKLEFESNRQSMYVHIIIIVIVAICLCFVGYKYYKSRAKKNDKKDEKSEAAGEKTEAAGEKSEDAGEKTEDSDEKIDDSGEKIDASGEKIEDADEKIKNADAEEETGTEEG